jgi:hypothetical protein
MAEKQARKQMRTAEVEDRIRTAKSKIAFLGAAVYPVMRNQEMRLNEEEMGGFHRMLSDIEDTLSEIADAEIIVTGQEVAAGKAAPQAEARPEQEAGSLNKITKEQYRAALRTAQKELSACTGPLMILHGYLDDHDPLDDGNALPDVLIAARDMVSDAADCVKRASEVISPLV